MFPKIRSCGKWLAWSTSDKLDPGSNPGPGKVFFYFFHQNETKSEETCEDQILCTRKIVNLVLLHFSIYGSESNILKIILGFKSSFKL